MATPPDFVAGSILTAEQLNKIGFWTVKNQTAFTAASLVAADNVFTDDFDYYRIVCRLTNSNTEQPKMRLRVAGVANSSANYNQQYLAVENAAVAGARQSGLTSWQFAVGTNGTFYSHTIIDVIGPKLAEPTTYAMLNQNTAGAYATVNTYLWTGNHAVSTAYDGFEFAVGTGTMTGTYAVYGYNE